MTLTLRDWRGGGFPGNPSLGGFPKFNHVTAIHSLHFSHFLLGLLCGCARDGPFPLCKISRQWKVETLGWQLLYYFWIMIINRMGHIL